MDISKKCFIKESSFVTRCIKDETIIVPVKGEVGDLDSIYTLDEDSIYTLDEVGSLVWKLIDGQTSVSQIIDAICSEYDTAPEEAEKDGIELLGSLEAAGLIRPSVNNQES